MKRLSSGCGPGPTDWSGSGPRPDWEVLASRAVTGRIRPDDMTCRATELAGGLRDADEAGYVDPGYSMDAAWRGALLPETGFDHLDDVPASLVIELARQGSELAKTHGSAHGPRCRCWIRMCWTWVPGMRPSAFPCGVCSL